ncbi:MAG: PQQ-like beta-propeller repeat protein [Planctomycetia bacterium]|nr:PQQ-like beta-propeller repeat protein [Planctomycetia bacterium]
MRMDATRVRFWCCLAGVLLVSASAAAAPPTAAPFVPDINQELSAPPEWTRVDVQWKPTWDETLAAHPIEKWQQELRQNAATAAMADQIAILKRIELLKAMSAHFPAEKTKRIAAYVEIASRYQQLGLEYWRGHWGQKLVHDFPDDKEAVSQGYQLMLAWNFGQYTHWGWFGFMSRPEAKDWEFAINEVINKHQAGQLKAEDPAVMTAYSHRSFQAADFLDYGQFHAMRKLRKGTHPGAAGFEEVLGLFGHNREYTADVPQGRDLNSADGADHQAEAQADSDLEFQWEAAKHGNVFGTDTEPVRLDRVQMLLDLAARSEAYVRDADRFVPLWTVIDRRLVEVPIARRQPLADAHEKAAKRDLDALRRETTGAALLRTFRRYPLAACLHDLLVEAAEANIRQGQFDAANRQLRDVLRHSTNDKLLAEAQASLWLALSQEEGSGKELEQAMAAVPDGAQLPWRGGTIAAGELKKNLLRPAAAAAAGKPMAFADLPRRRIVLPRDWPTREMNGDGPCGDMGIHAPWPVSQVQWLGDELFLSGPTVVARFNANPKPTAATDHGPLTTDQPTWLHKLPDQAMQTPWYDASSPRYTVGNSWTPSQEVRRGVRGFAARRRPDGQALHFLMTDQYPAHLEAVDPANGAVRWTTRKDATWNGLASLCQPAVVGDRIYTMAAPESMDRNAALGMVQGDNPPRLYVVCISGVDGHLLWKSRIGVIEGTKLDYTRGSAPISVREGHVYCTTNMGLLAQLDARDGTVERLHPYPFAIHQQGSAISINPRREGAAALHVRMAAESGADMLLVAPRDHTGVLALQRDSGKILWETPLVPSDKLVGVSGKVVVGLNNNWLTALDLTTGEQRYCRQFPEGTGTQAALIGGDVLLISAGKLLRIQAETGQDLEQRDLGGPDAKGVAGEFTLLPNGAIVEIVPPPLSPAKGPATAGKTLRLPLKEVWSVPCEAPRLVFRAGVGAGPDADANSFGVVSGRRVGFVRSKPNWEMAWDKMLPQRPQAVGLAGDRLLASDVTTLTSYDAATGAQQWSRDVPLLPYTIEGDAGLIYAGGRGNSSYYAALEPAGGKLLWAKPMSGDFRFGGTCQPLLMRASNGQAQLHLLTGIQSPDAGGRNGEAILDAATGQVSAVRQLMPAGGGTFGAPTYDTDGIGYLVSNWPTGRIMAFNYNSQTDIAAGWQKTLDLTAHRWHFRWVGIHCRQGVVYARLIGQLLRYDPATRKETVFDLSRAKEYIPPFLLDFREQGDKLIVVSGWTQQQPPRPGQHSPDPTDDDRWRVYVDIFDRATGQNLGRQELPGALACVSLIAYQTVAGYDTQVKILDDTIVVSDVNGVHVYAAGP